MKNSLIDNFGLLMTFFFHPRNLGKRKGLYVLDTASGVSVMPSLWICATC